jgi:hypothetical protein
MDIQIMPIVREYLSKNEIVISDNTDIEELVYKLAKSIDALIYNIVSVVALVASIEDQTKIEPKHLVAAQAYIAYKCIGKYASKKIIGGSHKITLDELNKIEPPRIDDYEDDSYSKQCQHVDLRDFIHHTLEHHKMQISKNAMKGILKLLHEHLECLLHNLKKVEPITIARLDKIMSMRRYSVFH